MTDNITLIQKGFRFLLKAFAPYVARELKAVHGETWWNDAVLEKLNEGQQRDLPKSGKEEELINSLDIQRALLLFDLHWHDVFRRKLSIDHRNWEKELFVVRNKAAHLGAEDFNDSDTWRALDTMSRLCEQIDSEQTEEIRALLREFRYGTREGSLHASAEPAKPNGKTSPKGGVLQKGAQGLPSWRSVIDPHPDVAEGRYKNAEFAADLAQVARGEGAYEYRDPVEFFNRTYITEGMTGLLVQSLKRVSGQDGEPVVQLKTAFGGGKTHSMLALYHLMRGSASLGKIASVQEILAAAGIAETPKINVAVLVGTALNPAKSRRPLNFPGITINTLWGEMTAQLAESASNPALYDYVKEADKKGVSPGSEALKNLFDACGPCLILMDELVAYAKKLYGVDNLPAGSFDNFITFVQEITEAARASKNSLVVAAIPESELEIGGEAGQRVLDAIQHTFGRMESIWKPVAASEGFEVVRRRLFLDCHAPEQRDFVCAKFSKMYQKNRADFPLESTEAEYQKRMISCYPIHPEVFDRLYEDWATLERFQRTRGVLRLMAAVIYELWMGNDASALIMPGSILLSSPNVRDELTRHLPDGWNAIVDREVDGKDSIPYQLDQKNMRYGISMAARRVARTVMLGSAPTSRAQHVRGVEASRIRLGVVQPGESVADFNDALNTLRSSLAYLYSSSGDRFWYDTRPTLRKTAEDRAGRFDKTDIEDKIKSLLRRLGKEAPLSGVHVCPASSLDVPDEQTARLVVMNPGETYKSSDAETSQAVSCAEDILDKRGNSPRSYRNMLVFVAPDMSLMQSLQEEVRRLLAWESIERDKEELNLDASQRRETESNLKRSKSVVDTQIKETYCWLLVPQIDLVDDMKKIKWSHIRIGGGTEGIVAKAVKQLIQNEYLIDKWAPAPLLMELDNLLWAEDDSIEIKKLWTYLCTYCYLPRLANYSVLENAIRAGVRSTDFFGLAAGRRNDGSFLDLKINQNVGSVALTDILVKIDAARKQKEAEQTVHASPALGASAAGSAPSSLFHDTDSPNGPQNGTKTPASGPTVGEPVTEAPAARNTSFFMSAELDNTRVNRDVQQLMKEIVNHLIFSDGAEVKITLEVSAEAANGFPQTTVRTVSENCRTLKVSSFGFED